MTPTEPGWRTTQANFVQTWQRVMTDPHGFFAEMPQAGGLNDPGIFILITAGLNAVSPSISADGEWFGFISEGSLMKQRISGGNPIKIGNAFTWGGSWGSDGAIITPIEWAQPVCRFPPQGGRAFRALARQQLGFSFSQLFELVAHLELTLPHGQGPMTHTQCSTSFSTGLSSTAG